MTAPISAAAAHAGKSTRGGTDRMYRLPLVPLPLEHEPLGWYLARAAAYAHLTLRDVASAAGLIGRDPDTIRAAYGFALTDRTAGALGTALGVDARRLQRLAPETLIAPLTGTRTLLRTGISVRRTRFCPRCIDERDGALRLEWLLLTCAICPIHRVLLSDNCHRCQRALTLGRGTRAGVPYAWHRAADAGRCPHPDPHDPRGICNARLQDSSATDVHRCRDVLKAQHRLDALVRKQRGAPAGPEALQAVRALCELAMTLLRPDDVEDLAAWAPHAIANHQSTRQAPKTEQSAWTAQAVAAVLPTVLAIVAGRGDADKQLQLLVTRAREASPHVAYRIPGLLPSPDLAARAVAALDRGGRHSLRLGLSVRRIPGAADRHPLLYGGNHVPPLLPVGEQHPIVTLAGRQRHDQTRRIASTVLVRLATHCTWAEAIAVLGLTPLMKANAPATLLSELRHNGNLEAWIQHIRRVAARLDADHSIDYRAQRLALAGLADLDATYWKNVCKGHNMRSARNGTRRRHAAAWVWARLTSADARLAPALRGELAVADNDAIARFRVFCRTLSAAVADELVRHALIDICPRLQADSRVLHHRANLGR
jgi:hypothetical protein